jgi:hypothetical protein
MGIPQQQEHRDPVRFVKRMPHDGAQLRREVHIGAHCVRQPFKPSQVTAFEPMQRQGVFGGEELELAAYHGNRRSASFRIIRLEATARQQLLARGILWRRHKAARTCSLESWQMLTHRANPENTAEPACETGN